MTSGTGGPEAKDIPDAVLWHEGMLLGPQHFQLASRRTEQLVAYLAAATLPYRWGLRRLSLWPWFFNGSGRPCLPWGNLF